jgi:hypothetical protein
LTAESGTIDLFEAVLREPPVATTSSGDLWGYSAALHHTGNPYASNVFSAKIAGANVVIGGPRGNIAGAVIDDTGYVFVCPLSSNAPCARGSDYEQLLYDTTDNALGGRGGDNPRRENKNEQLMGFSMRSRFGSLVVCAPGWKFRDMDNFFLQGKCLRLNKDLTFNSALEPCTKDFRNQLHNTLVNNDTEYGFGQCYAGVDVTLVNSQQGTNVGMGAPGALFFTGTGALTMGTGQLESNLSIAVSAPPEVPPLDDTSFTGMSVTRGRITSQTLDDLIVGSPRAENLRGHVRVIRGSFDTSVPMTYRLQNPAVVVPGDLVGAQFGLSLAAADLNGDGWDEVLVGAPFHFASAQRSELGAVHIFNNTGGNLTTEGREIIVGKTVSGRFGFSISSLGDLDSDGYDEVAISAPGGGGESGTVFIYSGRQGSITPVLTQTIIGSQLNLLSSALVNLTSFGSFVDGGTDIDGNFYNDLVIGAFEARKVFVLRSRTVAKITTSITADRETLPSNVMSFMVTFCMTFMGKGFVAGQQLELQYTVYSDLRDNNQTSRTIFEGGDDTMTGAMMVQVNSSLNDNCRSATITLKNPSVDIQTTPIMPSIIGRVGESPKPAPNDGGMIVTDLITNRIFAVPHNSSTQVLGERECGSDEICHFDLRLQSVEVVRPMNSVALVGFTSIVNISVTLSSAGPENAYSPRIKLTFPQGLAYSSVANPATRSCPGVTDTTAVCVLSNVVTQGDTESVFISLALATDTVPTFANSNITITAEILPPLNTNDNETDSSNNQGSVNLEVLSAADALVNILGGRSILSYTQTSSPRPGGGLPTSLDQLGRSVNISFIVLNAGPAVIPSASINVSIPYRSSCTKSSFLFYVGEVKLSPSITCTPSTPLDVLGLYSGGAVGSVQDVDGDCNRGILQRLDCSTDGTECINVVCDVSNFARNSPIQVNIIGYIDDHYYSSATFGTILTVSTSVTITSSDVIEGKQENNQGDVLVEIRVPPQTPPPPSNVEPWIIAVPIVIAILLIIALFIILYVCGFFKRKRPGDKDDKEGLTGEGATVEGETGEGGPVEGENGEGGTVEGGNGESGTVEVETAGTTTLTDPGTPL